MLEYGWGLFVRKCTLDKIQPCDKTQCEVAICQRELDCVEVVRSAKKSIEFPINPKRFLDLRSHKTQSDKEPIDLVINGTIAN